MVEGFCRPSVEAGSAAQRQAVQRKQRRLPTGGVSPATPPATPRDPDLNQFFMAAVAAPEHSKT